MANAKKDGLDEIKRLAIELEQWEHEQDKVEWKIEELRKALSAATLAYAATQEVSEIDSSKPRPWANDGHSHPKRVLAYFKAHPHAQVTVAKLKKAGIDLSDANLRTALSRLENRGKLRRVRAGVYTLAKPEQGEGDA